MPLSVVEQQTPLTIEQIREVIMTSLVQAEFPVEAWQANGAARSFVEAQCAVAAEQSKIVASLAAMAFLKSSKIDFLDHLGVSHYDEFRTQPIQTVFNVSMINQGAVTHGPLAVDAITLKASNGQTYRNTAIATITAGVTTVVQFKAEFGGALGNVPAQSLELVTPLAGVIAAFAGEYISVGSDLESDAAYKEKCRTKWGTLRVERVHDGFLNLARKVAPAIRSVILDDDNPRGPGTADLYLAATNATAGIGDVALVQAALDLAVFGNGSAGKLVRAFASPTQAVNLAGDFYFSGVNSVDYVNDLTSRWRAFLETVPIGGFDLSPGPKNIVMNDQIVQELQEVDGFISSRLTSPPTTGLIVAVNSKVIEGTIAINPIQVKA